MLLFCYKYNNGMSWRKEITDSVSPVVAEQTLGISEAFNIRVDEYYGPGDYLYRSGSLKWDVESGMWGIFRVVRKGIRYCCECTGRTVSGWWKKKKSDKNK